MHLRESVKSLISYIVFVALTVLAFAVVIRFQDRFLLAFAVLFAISVVCYRYHFAGPKVRYLAPATFLVFCAAALWAIRACHIRIMGLEGDFPIVNMYLMVCALFSAEFKNMRMLIAEHLILPVYFVLYILIRLPEYRYLLIAVVAVFTVLRIPFAISSCRMYSQTEE